MTPAADIASIRRKGVRTGSHLRGSTNPSPPHLSKDAGADSLTLNSPPIFPHADYQRLTTFLLFHYLEFPLQMFHFYDKKCFNCLLACWNRILLSNPGWP